MTIIHSSIHLSILLTTYSFQGYSTGAYTSESQSTPWTERQKTIQSYTLWLGDLFFLSHLTQKVILPFMEALQNTHKSSTMTLQT